MDEQTFLKSASDFARSGFQAYLHSDWPIFFLHSGAALEHLSKAHLSSIHPALVADGNNFISLLYACRLGRRRESPPEGFRTITVKEALRRSGQLLGGLQSLSGDLTSMIRVRNSVTHAALLDRHEGDRVLVPYLKAIDVLLEALGSERGAFWGAFVGKVDARLITAIEDAKERAKMKIDAARRAFELMIAGVAPADLEHHLISIEYSPARAGEEIIDCPVCRRKARVRGTGHVELETEYEYSGGDQEVVEIGVIPHVIFFPRRLKCPVCGLELEGVDELLAAGQKADWELVDADPGDYELREELETPE